MATDWAKLATQGSTQNKFSSSKQDNKGTFSGPLQDIGEKSGLYQLPVIGGIARGIVQPLASAAETVAEPTLGTAANIVQGKDLNERRFMSPHNFQEVQGGGLPAITNALGTGLSAGLATDAILGGPDIVKGAVGAPGAIKGALGWLKNGNAQNISTAAKAATETGVTDTLANVATEFRKAVEDKFAPQGLDVADNTLKNAYGNVLKHISGAPDTVQTVAKMKPQEITGELSPDSLVRLRQSVVSRFGYNPENGNIEQKVANIARDILTKRAKDIAPGLAQADKSYMLRQNFGKEVLPAILKYGGIGGGILGALGIAKTALSPDSASQDNSQP